MSGERVEKVDGVTYEYGYDGAVFGFITDGVEVDPSKGFEGTGMESLEEWNRSVEEQTARLNQIDPFERKEQKVKLHTKLKLTYRNWNRNRKLGINA